MSKSSRIATDGSASSLAQNPFAALSAAGLPAHSPAAPLPGVAGPSGRGAAGAPPKNRGRVEVRRETGGRGGKTVTTVSGFMGIGLPEKEALAKRMQKTCGAGGTVKDGQIEIQGDRREAVARILEEAGFRPVMAGG
ncbi:MAG: translation initiation factor [Opitutaceae bacterium]|nr:translation initiation factor [Opitutaceae bacterium]